jgi:epoxyqueuosine reductase
MSSEFSNNSNISDKKYLTNMIKAKALSLGFSAIGIAKAEAVDNTTGIHFRQWIDEGKHAGMDYMCHNIDKRLNPKLLMGNAKSIISVALNYYPQRLISEEQYQISFYAYGKDYHELIKDRLHTLAAELNFTNYRAFCDTAPILERYWAVKAGLGWTGRNHQLIIPHAGSTFFLGELFLDIELEYDHELQNRCGNCHRCIDSCPTDALHCKKGLDANRCLSYLTIENHGEIPDDLTGKMGNYIYGCDRCILSCPWSRFSSPTTEPQLQPTEELLNLTKEQWCNLTIEEYRYLFKKSAIKRAKYEGLMRNIHAINKKY